MNLLTIIILIGFIFIGETIILLTYQLKNINKTLTKLHKAMSNQFDMNNLKILQKKFLDKGITDPMTIGLLMKRSTETIKKYKQRLNGTYNHEKFTSIKKHKQY